MPNTTILPIGLPDESDDAPKKFTNIDKEDFSCTWDGLEYVVKPEETVTHPKYLVNYMAQHLARKILKREALEAQPSPEFVKHGTYHWKDEKKEKELQDKMVAANFPEKIEKPLEEKKEEANPLKCKECGFEAKSEFGLKSHIRAKHKK